MSKQLYLLALLLCTSMTVFGQERINNYSIYVSSAPIRIENKIGNNWDKIKSNKQSKFNEVLYLLVQFNDIPSTEKKEYLKHQGIELLDYIPNFAWIAKVDPNLELEDLLAANVRNISKVKSDWKMSDGMRSLIVPEQSGTLANTKVRVLFWKEKNGFDYSEIIKEFIPNILSENLKQSWIEIESPLSSIIELANHPLVQFIEFIEPPVELDGIKEERERAISTYISENPGKNYYFDGTGVKIGVDEGGIVDTLQNPNFRNRIDRNYEGGNVSGHKTGVSLRMGGAGNINPLERGNAFGAEVFSGLSNAEAATNGVIIINRSYGWGCPSSTQTYSSASANYDNYVRTNPTNMITHSAGNAGSSNCYANASGWGNITGMAKMAKNIFDVGSSNNDGDLTGFSSRGPAKDGRILPHIVAPGPGGTSHASPNLGGVFGQLNQAYRFHNGGVIPNSGLLKAVLLNTADDMLNPGPDYKTGYGHVNARRAYEVIRQGQFQSSTISQSESNNHMITVPVNVKEVKVLVYWVDWEATSGITTRALVNDIDMVLQDPTTYNFMPWVLNPALDSLTLNDTAVRAIDTLNNAEQVTIDNPISGNYQLTVSGTMIPIGPQEYFLTYEFVYDDIFVTHPHGGEKFVPGETERIRWDACDSILNFDLSYSIDNGTSWNSIATAISPGTRYYDWSIPTSITNQALVRVNRGSTQGESDTSFNILAQPSNLEHIWTCADSSFFKWDAFNNADGYIVYRIVGDYMDSIAYTTSTSIVLNGLSLSETEYISIAVVQNSVISRRIIAIEREPIDLNCNLNDLGALQILSPGTANVPSCMTGTAGEIKILIHNWGVNIVDSIPVAFRINGGVVSHDTLFSSIPVSGNYSFTFSSPPNMVIGTNLVEAWTEFSGDNIFINDTAVVSVVIYSSNGNAAALTQNFDSFTNCGTSWNCELENCLMQNGWYNLPNGAGDDIDWRTHVNGTATGNTGPSGDHTTGSGKYLYLEGSGPCINSTARLYSPCLDMTGINQAEMSFWYHAFGSGIGELHVDAIADGVLYEDLIAPLIGQQGNLWINQTVDISQFTGQLLVVVIRGSTGGGFYSDLAIDDINISTSPIANFNTSKTQVCSSDIVATINNSLYGTSYEWSFQPNTFTYLAGTNSSHTNPMVNFNAPGYYTVQLIATNSIGSDTLTYPNYIYVWDDAPLLSPINSFCNYDSVEIFSNNNGQPVDYYLNGSIVNSSSDSSHLFLTANDSDSVYVSYDVNSDCTLFSDTLFIDLIDVENGAVLNGTELSAVAIGASYQWLDCNNNYAPILGETNQSYFPTIDGEYAVQVAKNGCIDTSECIEYVNPSNSLVDYNWESLAFYPNPTSKYLTIDLGKAQSKVTIKINNILGKIMNKTTFENTSIINLELSGETGVYLIEISAENKSRVIRVIKKDK